MILVCRLWKLSNYLTRLICLKFYDKIYFTYEYHPHFYILYFSFYTIIVNPKIEDLSFDPKPSEVTSYNKENPDKAYISGILSTHQPLFVVGMCILFCLLYFCEYIWLIDTNLLCIVYKTLNFASVFYFWLNCFNI